MTQTTSPLKTAHPEIIYLDYQATTPCDPRVIDTMMPYLQGEFGNPHSSTHVYGWKGLEAVEIARHQVAAAIGANAKEVIFTSGATEANNMALKGVLGFYKDVGKTHIITTMTEHKCILNSCRRLEREGFQVTYLPVEQNGLVNLKTLEEAFTPQTGLVSVMAVNNEIGVIQPLKEIGALCRQKGVFFHTDAAQALGKISLDVEAMNIDLMSLSSHKIYGPKGVGALYVRRKPRVRLLPLMDGGGQERGMRSGTLAPFLCAGFGKACEIAVAEREEETARLVGLRDRFYTYLKKHVADMVLNGDFEARVPGNLNLSFAYVEGEGLMMGLKDLALSSGSACTSDSLEPSYVLRALGVDEGLIHTSLRIGFGRYTTEKEVDYAAKRIAQTVNKLREMSPLWEMVQEGIDLNSIRWDAH
ncbi:MAG: IscS subfamily cysteine desulfurase [Alphaproteobacteria bacterium]|jgi:cysteine desulfurase|nr:IscS subfamily cysteine desulfurase [Alphaproteobacteria bacterium]